MANISVFVRMRPILQSELKGKEKLQNRLKVTPDDKKIIAQLNDKKDKIFNFDRIFKHQTTQQQLYEGLNVPMMVGKVLDGFHSTIFAYGQTGSGKTYTIDGPTENLGLIPRAINELFETIQQKNQNQRTYKVNISFYQIYNEGIYDLIDVSGKALKMRWNKHQQFMVENLFEGQCRNKEDALKWWKKGQKNKIMGAHKMNSVSSRSHSILTIRVNSYDLEDPSDVIESKLEIVDLAGSERHKVTKSTGVVFKEGIEINKSLFTLRQVISALYEQSQTHNPNKHIPYRDSRLTSLLKQSIGGNTYCAMIACLNPTATHFQQSFQTLTYASMASYINNNPTKNIDPKIKQNTLLRQQNQQYRQEIKKMAEHIEKLTKMLEAGVCSKCSEQKITLQKQQSQPSGLKKKQIQFQAEEKKVVRNRVPIQKKTLKTTKDVLESITMIKELINANSGLRQKIEVLKSMHQNQQKQMYTLMKENQVLRDRWDMLNGAFIPEQVNTNEAPICQLERMIKEEKGIMEPSKNRIHSQYSTTTKNSNYNDFLMKNVKPKRRKNTFSLSKTNKIDSFNF